MAIISPAGEISRQPGLLGDARRPDVGSRHLRFEEFLHGEDRSQFLDGMSELLLGDVPSLRQELRYPRPMAARCTAAPRSPSCATRSGEIEQLIVQIVE